MSVRRTPGGRLRNRGVLTVINYNLDADQHTDEHRSVSLGRAAAPRGGQLNVAGAPMLPAASTAWTVTEPDGTVSVSTEPADTVAPSTTTP